MKNFFLIACFSLLLTGLSITAVTAAQPGCDASEGGMLSVMQNHASALRVQDRAYARQIIKRNDPSLGLTCFDQALGLTSRLGLIFSDDLTIPPVLPNASVFKAPIQYPMFGADQILLTDLNTVVTPVVTNYLDDFTGTLSEPLGTAEGDWLSGIMGALSGSGDSFLQLAATSLSTITDAASSVTGLLSTITDPIGTISTSLDSLTGAIGTVTQPIGTLTTDINNLLTPLTDITSAIPSAGDLLGSITTSALDSMGLGSLSDLSSMLPLDGITSALPMIEGLMGGLDGIMGSIDSVLSLLSSASPLAVPGISALFNSLIDSMLDSFMSSAMSSFSSMLTPMLGSITSTLTGSATSMDCNRIDQFWNGGAGAPAGFVPVEGSGIEAGTPYFNFEALVNASVSGGGDDLMDELTSAKNSPILQKALSDLQGPLSAPGQMPSWKAVPVIPAGASVADIINSM